MARTAVPPTRAALRDAWTATGEAAQRTRSSGGPSSPRPDRKDWRSRHRTAVLLTDLVLLPGACLLAIPAALPSSTQAADQFLGGLSYAVVGAGLAVVWLICLAALGAYVRTSFSPGGGELRLSSALSR